MKIILAEAMELYRSIGEHQKLNQFATFVESLRRDDAPENHKVINTIMEGVGAIMEANVPKSAILDEMYAGTDKVDYQQLNADAEQALRDGDTAKAKKLFVKVTVPYLRKMLNVVIDTQFGGDKRVSKEDAENAFQDLMVEVLTKVDSYDPDHNITGDSGEKLPFLALNFGKKALSKYILPGIIKKSLGSRPDARAWKADIEHRKGSEVYHNGNYWKRTSKDLPEDLKGLSPDQPEMTGFWIQQGSDDTVEFDTATPGHENTTDDVVDNDEFDVAEKLYTMINELEKEGKFNAKMANAARTVVGKVEDKRSALAERDDIPLDSHQWKTNEEFQKIQSMLKGFTDKAAAEDAGVNTNDPKRIKAALAEKAKADMNISPELMEKYA
jgi:hypothetical protein